MKNFLFILYTLMMAINGVSQSVTPSRKQLRLDERINRLVNKRYGDSIQYEIGYDIQHQKLVLSNPLSLKFMVQNLNVLQFTVDTATKANWSLRRELNSIRGEWSHDEGKTRKEIDSLIQEIAIRKTIFISDEKEPDRSQVKIITRFIHLNPPSTIPKEVRDTIDYLLTKRDIDVSVIESLRQHNTSLRKMHTQDSIDKARAPAILAPPPGETTWSRAWDTAWLLILALSLWIVFNYATQEFLFDRHWFARKIDYYIYKCYVVDIKNNCVIADVLIDPNNDVLEMREFEALPLKGVIPLMTEGEIFQLRCSTFKGRKIFDFLKADPSDEKLFKGIYTKREDIPYETSYRNS